MIKDVLHYLTNLTPDSFLTYLIVGVSFLTVGTTVYFVLYFFLKRFSRKEEYLISEQVVRKMKKPLLLLLHAASLLIPLSVATYYTNFIRYFRHFIIILLITSISWLAISALRIVRLFFLKQFDIQEKDNLRARKIYTQLDIMERIAVVIIVVISVAIILMTFGSIKRIGISLFASAGVAGIIMGLAAQKLIATFLAGVQLALTQPIRLDDVVIVEKEWGWIEEINLTYVVVRIWDKRRLVLPATYFIEKPFQNWTRVSADILGTVFIYTDYTVPFEKLREELTRLLQLTDLWDGNVNVLQVTDAKEKTVEIRALVSAADSPTAWDLRVYVREKLIEFLQKKHPGSLPKTRVVIDETSRLN